VCDGVTLLEIVTGNANGPMAFLTRRLRVKGDLAFAAQLPTFFHIPRAG
jgi:putative sterol carrier protein